MYAFLSSMHVTHWWGLQVNFSFYTLRKIIKCISEKKKLFYDDWEWQIEND